MVEFVQELVDGVLIGSTYALVGIGFTLLWGFMRKYNMGYGATAIGAAFLGLYIYTAVPGIPIPLLFVVTAVMGAALGLVVQVLCFRLLPKNYVFAPLLSSLGILFLIEEAINHVTEGRPQSFPALVETSSFVGPFIIRLDYVAIFALSVLLVFGTYRVLFKTKVGLALRATAQQPRAAQLVGIDPIRVDLASFVLTGALAGVAGLLVTMGVGTASSGLATTYTVKGLAVAVIGGLGSIPGAIAGGLLVGVVESEANAFLGISYRDIFVFLTLFAVLILRPQGLLGKKEG
ncbi:MAG: branched-chain amino acid ABC transporter permease [Acidimicrobiia bacterium]